jgi:hypothetical protein
VGSIVHVYDTPNGEPQAAIVTSIFRGAFDGGLAMDVTVFEDREHKNGRAMVTRRRLAATPGDHSPSRWQSYWVWPDEEEA